MHKTAASTRARVECLQCADPMSSSDTGSATRGRRPRLGALTHRCGRRPGHDETAMARIRIEQAAEPDEVTARARHQRGQANDEVQRREHHVGGAIGKRGLELLDHQPVAVAAQALQGNGRVLAAITDPREITAVVLVNSEGLGSRQPQCGGEGQPGELIDDSRQIGPCSSAKRSGGVVQVLPPRDATGTSVALEGARFSQDCSRLTFDERERCCMNRPRSLMRSLPMPARMWH